ncbi:uncharacterized protein LOC144305530 isoform X2 [Canis aureus]
MGTCLYLHWVMFEQKNRNLQKLAKDGRKGICQSSSCRPDTGSVLICSSNELHLMQQLQLLQLASTPGYFLLPIILLLFGDCCGQGEKSPVKHVEFSSFPSVIDHRKAVPPSRKQVTTKDHPAFASLR